MRFEKTFKAANLKGATSPDSEWIGFPFCVRPEIADRGHLSNPSPHKKKISRPWGESQDREIRQPAGALGGALLEQTFARI